MKNYVDYVMENLRLKSFTWHLDPFPHAVIDDFFPAEIFAKLSKISPEKHKDLKRLNTSAVELFKSEFGINHLPEIYRLPAELMAYEGGKFLFSKLIDMNKIITMGDFENFAGYYPFHSSKRGGKLGAHVDHSSLDKLFHFSNSLFYCHERWEDDWGGETILFNKNGLCAKKYIRPKPNRMILFLHTNTSFHGVNTIRCPNNYYRNSYYMDYYIRPKDIKELRSNLKEMGYKKPVRFSYHPTSFIPFIPNGLASFEIKSLFSKKNYPYLKTYLVYWLMRLPGVTAIRFALFDKIRKIKGRKLSYLKTK